MKTAKRRVLSLTLLAIGFATAPLSLAQRPFPIPSSGSKTPAELRIERAHKFIATQPGRVDGYNDLAFALTRRARETGDPTYYERADEALQRALALDADNYEAQKLQVWSLLGRHRFAEAAERAGELNQRAPDDVSVYGFLVDAHAELGDYDAAEKAAQWMLDLRPGNVAGLTRAAYLRELFGDIDGAVQLMDSAFHRTPSDEVEDRAWILTQIAHLQLSAGRIDNAEKLLHLALDLFPNYHYALAKLAEVRAAQARYDDAVELQRRRHRLAAHPENLYELALALERAGRKEEAGRTFQEFEKQARAEMEGEDNANLELVFYYANHALNPDEALHVAGLEVARRRGVHVLDAHAWALHAAGKYSEARSQIEKALAVGIRDAGMLYRAGVIAAKLKDLETAGKYLSQSLEVNPRSAVADSARMELARLR